MTTNQERMEAALRQASSERYIAFPTDITREERDALAAHFCRVLGADPAERWYPPKRNLPNDPCLVPSPEGDQCGYRLGHSEGRWGTPHSWDPSPPSWEIHYGEIDQDGMRPLIVERECNCPEGMKYHASNCPITPGQLRSERLAWLHEQAKRAEERLRAMPPDSLGPAARTVLGMGPRKTGLEAEVEHLRALVASLSDAGDAAANEIELLRAENERLKAAGAAIAKHHASCAGWPIEQDRCTCAFEGDRGVHDDTCALVLAGLRKANADEYLHGDW